MDTARFSTVFPDSGPEVMPTVERLADEGANFEQAMTTGPWTVPSHASMFTGLYTSDHRSHAGTKRFDPPYAPLAERLADAGYQTAAFSNNTWLSSPFGFDRGFETFRTRWELFDGGEDLAAVAKAEGVMDKFRTLFEKLVDREAPLTVANFLYAVSLSYQSTKDSGAERTTRRILEWFDSDDDRPFFGFVNYVEPHLPYDPPAAYRDEFLPEGMDHGLLDRVNQDPWAYLTGEVVMNARDFEALLALYRAELHYLDSCIERLYDRLEHQGILDETVIVVVGDHGENIGDHGLMDHQYCLYNTLLHVPCVVRYPKAFDPGTRVKNLIELRDLFPTLLELTGLPVPDHPNVSEHSLAYPTERSIGREYAIAEYLAPQPSMEALSPKVESEISESVKRYDRALRAIQTDKWKYTEGSDSSQELYNLSTDPQESENVITEKPATAKRLRKLLKSDRSAFAPKAETTTANVDTITEQRLEDLGYL
jgi:arylsulfatase A-like enzyme